MRHLSRELQEVLEGPLDVGLVLAGQLHHALQQLEADLGREGSTICLQPAPHMLQNVFRQIIGYNPKTQKAGA